MRSLLWILLIASIPCSSFEVKCKFKEDVVWRGYCCEVQEFMNFNRNARISELSGQHLKTYSNSDVESFRVDNFSSIKYFTNDVFVKFTNLRNLVIHSTSLQYLMRGDFALATHLHNVFITHNHITALEDYCFYGVQRLKTLNLRNNKISEIAENAFRGLKTLKYLTLTANEIEILHSNTFIDQIYMEQLSLSSNKLRHIDELLFSETKNLEVIFLENNLLEVISGKMFQHNQRLREIYMDNNHIKHITNVQHFLVNLKDLEVAIFLNNTCVNIQIFIMQRFHPPYQRVFENCEGKWIKNSITHNFTHLLFCTYMYICFHVCKLN